MKRSTLPLWVALLAAASAVGCGGAVIDGGQSGTGISAIRGNVVAAAGAQLELADIRVSLAATNLATHTDAGGRFELQGQASGPAELRFERERDRLFARTDVVVPAGGVLELSEIVLDPDSDEARPTMRRVEFDGFVQSLDCAGGAIVVTAGEDEAETVFTVDVESATIRSDDAPLACTDLRVGDHVEVDAVTADGSTLVDAVIVLEDREDEHGGESHDESDDAGDDEGHDAERAPERHRREEHFETDS
jgi:hypothetical protein